MKNWITALLTIGLLRAADVCLVSQTGLTASGTVRGMVLDRKTSRPIGDVDVTLIGRLTPTDFHALQHQIEIADATEGVIPDISTLVNSFITISRTEAASLFRFATSSDINGVFVLRGVQPGDYVVQLKRKDYFETFADDPNRTLFGSILHVDAGQTAEFASWMAPGGSISGRVKNMSALAEVSAFVMGYQYGIPMLVPVGTTTSKSNGEFTLQGLPPREYIIGATAFPHAYHPATADAHTAKVVVIRAGESLSKVDIDGKDVRSITISGQTDPPKGVSFTHAGYRVIPKNEDAWLPFTAVIRWAPRDPNRFEIPGVSPGSYDLYSVMRLSTGGLIYGRTPIDVGTKDLKNIAIQVQQRIEARGTIKFNGNAVVRGTDSQAALVTNEPTRLNPAEDGTFSVSLNVTLATTPIQVALEPDDGARRLPVYRGVGRELQGVVSNGAFAIPQVPAGRFRARVDILDLPGAYVADIRQSGASVYDSGINITEHTPEPLEVHINTNGGTLEGAVYDQGRAVRSGVFVVLAPPAGRRQNRALYKTAFTDERGQFVIRGIPPGQFKLFAWNTIPVGAYMNAAFLARFDSLAESIEISESGHLNATVRVMR
jgi:hypothetical protein